MRRTTFGVLTTLCLLYTTTLSQTLPYNPTTVLIPASFAPNNDLVYIFRPQGTSAKHQLVSLNVSATISSSNLKFDVLSANLPFQSDESTPYTPAISSFGDLTVYTGSCTSTAPQLWRLSPDVNSTTGNGVWKQEETSGGPETSRARFLSRSITFSTFVYGNASQTNIYVFGGMCPGNETNSVTTWQSDATYSNTMLRLAPTTSDEYALGLPTSRGPPIAEAGFTITGLTPTYSNRSGIMTQQENFVLLGGHTQTAFLNMSQIAIWSMPEESWSFVTVSPSTSNGNTELTVKSTVSSVDSRSGHTTVLSEDGTSLIVYGGWVGDVGTAADPQLAILRLGSGFGGEGNWQWTVPSEQPSGNAVYGHGATILPGNVMMIAGGYEISGGNSKRQTSTQARFWNATSMSWIQDYTNPSYVAAIAKQKADAVNSSSKSKNLGLGVGLGVGLFLVIVALAVFCCYSRKVRRNREMQEDSMDPSSGHGAAVYTPRGMQEREGGNFPWISSGWNNRSRDTTVAPGYDSDAAPGYENLNSGVHGLGYNGQYPAAPKQIPRKPLHSRNARGSYQPTPNYDFNAANNHGRANSLGTAGPIHPIYEADEEEQSRKSVEALAFAGASGAGPSDRKRYSDPFKDPLGQQPVGMPFRSNSMAETDISHRSREREIQEWVSDWAAAESLMNSQMRSHSNAGRISPTRRAQLIAASTISSMSGDEDSGRTASNLSEQSVAVSSISISRSGSSSQSRSRTNSLRGFITTAMSPFSAAAASSTAPSTVLAPAYDRNQPVPKSAGSTSSSFNTAHTSFHPLQVEGETLLAPPSHWDSGQSSPTRSEPETPGSPSKNKGAFIVRARAGNSWLGSIRRAIIGQPEHDDHDFQSVPSRDNSPIRIDYGQGNQPRRTVSAGATLLRRKQGKSDWEDSALESPTGQGSRSNTFGNDIKPNSHRGSTMTTMTSVTTDDEEDWDIEQAVQNRVVQVMFTVPKEKLRVVNHDVRDDVSMSDIASLRSKQGSGKSIFGVTDSHLDSVSERSEERPTYTLSDPPVPVFTSRGKEREIEAPRWEYKGKGKEREVDLVREMEREVQREMDAEKSRKTKIANNNGSPVRDLRTKKSRVLDLVETFEQRGSPER